MAWRWLPPHWRRNSGEHRRLRISKRASRSTPANAPNATVTMVRAPDRRPMRCFPRPRDFTRGIYKIRSTPSGTVPTDDDLFRSITNGLPGTSMPGWGVLPERDRRQVVQYIKTFSQKFKEETPTPITIPAGGTLQR